MRRVSPNAFLMPSAVTVMGTLTSEGVVDFSTMSAVGVVCLTPAIVAVGVKPRRTAFANLMTRGSFSLLVPEARHLWLVDRLGTRSLRRHPLKPTLYKDAVDHFPSDNPILRGMPIALDCEVIQALGRPDLGHAVSHQIVIAEVKDALVDDALLMEGVVDTRKLHPIFYLARQYFSRGSHLGSQRFTDDDETMRAKMAAYEARELP